MQKPPTVPWAVDPVVVCHWLSCLFPVAASCCPPSMYADEDTHHLGNVKEVLELLGYQPTNTPADANIIWAWHDPFTKADPEQNPKLSATFEHLRNLQEYQFVNHLPGMGFLATKPKLAKLSAHLRSVPRTFQLPAEYKAWQKYIKTEQGSKIQWIQKSKSHRYVSPQHRIRHGLCLSHVVCCEVQL